jgi:hypothetical protein
MDEFSLWTQVAHRFRVSCSEFDRLWMKRRRRFDTNSVVQALLHLVGGSQTSYAQVLESLRQKENAAPAASSFCVARQKFPAFLLNELRQAVVDQWDELRPGDRWRDRRIFAVDGSKVSLPQPLSRQGFEPPVSGHCPQALVSLLLRLDDRMICDIRLTSDENERTQAHEHLEHLTRGDLVVYDRGYLSFALLADHAERQVDAVFRVADAATFLPLERFWRSNATDSIVTLDPTSVTYRSARRIRPEIEFKPLPVRLIKYRIKQKTYVLATTMMARNIGPEDFAKLYARRWTAEEAFKSLKQTLAMEEFHAKHTNGVEQEVSAMALLWNLNLMFALSVRVDLKKNQELPQFIAVSGELSAGSKASLSPYRRPIAARSPPSPTSAEARRLPATHSATNQAGSDIPATIP